MYFYPWPNGADDPVLNHSLKIAMDYLVLTGQDEPFDVIQMRAALAILAAFRLGAPHPVRLSNCAIRAIENARAGTVLESVYPRVS